MDILDISEIRRFQLIKYFSKIIWGKEYADKLDQKILNNKILWFGFMVLFVWNSLLGISYMDVKKNNKVVVDFPPVQYGTGIQEIGNDFANDEFFASWGMFLINSIASFDRENIQSRIDFVANKMTADNYLEKKEIIDKYIEDIKANKIRANFTTDGTSYHVESKRTKNKYDVEVVTVVANGDMTKTIGNFKSERLACQFNISLFRKGGVTYVEEFGTNCF